MKKSLTATFIITLVLAGILSLGALAETPAKVTIQRLDGGQNWVGDLNRFCDTLAYPGQKKMLTVSSYLIRHNDDYLLWDAGLPTEKQNAPLDPSKASGQSFEKTISTELKELGVDPTAVKYLGLSHYHADHCGQANAFPQATLLTGEGDWERLTSSDQDPSLQRQYLSHWLEKNGGGRVQTVSGDLDIFSDGTVIMLATPGHTPGHHSLLVRLPESGNILLTGDVAHFKENYDNNRIPGFNTNRADSVSSLSRFKELAGNLKATVIIQHEPEHIKRLPPFPAAAK